MQIPESILWENDRQGNVKFKGTVWICAPAYGDNLFIKATADCTATKYSLSSSALFLQHTSYDKLMWLKRYILEVTSRDGYYSLVFYFPTKITGISTTRKPENKIIYRLKGLSKQLTKHVTGARRYLTFMYTTYEECVSKCEDLNKSFNWESIQPNYDLIDKYTIALKLHLKNNEYLYK